MVKNGSSSVSFAAYAARWVAIGIWLTAVIGLGCVSAAAQEAIWTPAEGNPQQCRFDPPYLEAQIRSRVCFQRDEKELQVLLVPREETTRLLRDQDEYCGGFGGDTEYEGYYQLIGLVDGVQVSGLDLLSGNRFNANRPEYGLHRYAVPNGKEVLVALYEYAGCNNDQIRFYRLDDIGDLHSVLFIGSDGASRQAEYLSHPGKISWSDEKGMSFCWYDNYVGHGRCRSYRFDSENWIQTDER